MVDTLEKQWTTELQDVDSTGPYFPRLLTGRTVVTELRAHEALLVAGADKFVDVHGSLPRPSQALSRLGGEQDAVEVCEDRDAADNVSFCV